MHVQTASQGDMPTILETNREVRGDWNPIHESWLPSAMTTQFLGGTPPLSGTEPPKQEDAEARSLRLVSYHRPGLDLNDQALAFTLSII